MSDKDGVASELLRGKLVRLRAEDPEAHSRLFVGWSHDSEYWRLIANGPAHPWTREGVRKHIQKEIEKEDPRNIFFAVHALDDERVIGEIGLDGISYTHGESFVGIGIGERELWGKGYGTDAMNVMLRYAFTELNLHRVSLTVFEYNPRAIRSYEKCGFRVEGHARETFQREGRRWDLIFMGILRDEWMAANA